MSSTPAPPELPGYRFLTHIGAGGNAHVYLYEQELPNRKVAVKVLNDSALSDAARRRFTTEANVTAVLAHRHIVQVFDAKVTDDGRPYIVMPFYPKPNLSVRARRAHFSVAEVLRIGIQIGSAVETSHRHGVLHRDIKPQNILTDAYGEPALTDFGIATTKAGDGPEGLSVPWSPPEILYGTGPGDQRSDVYSLGATLWHLLVGHPPIEQPDGGNTTAGLRDRINSGPPPRTERADVPNSLERLLRQTMAKDPAARPQSAMELIRGLQSIEQELRLPVTQPILPADESMHPDTRGDTVARPVANGGDSTSSRVGGPAFTDSFSTDTDTDTDSPSADGGQPAGSAEGTGGLDAAHATGRTQDPDAAQATGEPGAADADPSIPQEEPSRDQTAGEEPDQPRWNSDMGNATITRGRQPGAPWRPAPGAADHATLTRTPVRLNPSVTPETAQPSESAAALARTPIVLDPRGGAAPKGPTTPVARSTGSEQVAGREQVAAGQDRPRSRRILAFAGGGALLAVVAVVAVLVLPRGAGSPPTAPTGTGQSALGPGAAAPGQPTVTASADAAQVEFSWTYANPASGDTFRVQVSGGVGDTNSIVTKPDLLLTVAKGRSVCVTVIVRSADGQASAPSNQVCWPK